MHIAGDDRLARFLREATARPFTWPEWNCMLFALAWVRTVSGGPCGERWIGRAGSALDAARILREAGGAVAFLERELAKIGLQRTSAPRRGDVAVIAAPDGATGAVVLGRSAAVLGMQGLRVLPLDKGRGAQAIAAWTVSPRRASAGGEQCLQS